MKRYLLFAVVLLAALVIGLQLTANTDPSDIQDGDLIFHTSTSNQSSAIFVATAHPYTHMGIIRKTGNSAVVIEAVGTVRETPLKSWISRGTLKRFAIYRANLTPKQRNIILSTAKAQYGKSYDPFFSFNNEKLYCSELPYVAYKAAGIALGNVQKVGDLNFDNALVRSLIEKRWKRHNECTARHYNFDQCYDYILKQELVTPASIANDQKLERIYSNYPL